MVAVNVNPDTIDPECPLDDAEDSLTDKAAELKRQLTSTQRNNHERNLQLDALRIVWCNGGCEEGMARYGGEHPTEEIVQAAEANTVRMRTWLTNRRLKTESNQEPTDG